MTALRTRLDRLERTHKAKNDTVHITVRDAVKYTPIEERQRRQKKNPHVVYIFAHDEDSELAP